LISLSLTIPFYNYPVAGGYAFDKISGQYNADGFREFSAP